MAGMSEIRAALSLRAYPVQSSDKVHRAIGSAGHYTPSWQAAAGCGVLDSSQENVAVDPWADLVVATAEGDKDAFARLYRESSGKLMAIALRMIGRRDLAEDILQEAFVAIWRKANQFEPDRGRSFTWLAAIVRYRTIDRLRADNREVRDVEPLDDREGGALEIAGADPRSHEPESLAVRACLGRLPKDQRRAIVLAYYYGFTHEELADRLQTPLGTVKSWVRRGLLQLRTCLET